MNRHPLTAVVCAALACAGCSSRDSERRVYHLERDNRRLSSELSAAQAENRVLEREREVLRQQEQSEPPPARASAGLDRDDVSLPTVDAIDASVERELAGDAPAVGAYVLVLASVGAGHAESQRAHYQQTADELNRRAPHGLEPLFGVRNPRSGGLQLVYGVSPELGIGIDRARCQRATQALQARYRDCYILDTR